MKEFTKVRIAAKSVRSLCWHGDTLIDWAGGIRCFHLDGHVEPGSVIFSYVFDAALMVPGTEYVVIFTRLGTKGIIWHQNRVVREINRSFYYASDFEYPITAFRLPDGRPVLAHCPEHYNHLEIEDLVTGGRLTATPNRKPADYFFSRLAANNAGTRLLSGGWIWHPIDCVSLFSTEEALRTPTHLDRNRGNFSAAAQKSAAAFMDDDHLVVWLQGDLEEFEDPADLPALLDSEAHPPSAGELRVLDLRTGEIKSRVRAAAAVGSLMPLDGRHVIGFYGHPKLLDLRTGVVVQEWPEILSGHLDGSLMRHGQSPPIALDPLRHRFAVADEEGIDVVQVTL